VSEWPDRFGFDRVVFGQLTQNRSWSLTAYQNWPAEMLSATLLSPAP
jgi:hypothetical protein